MPENIRVNKNNLKVFKFLKFKFKFMTIEFGAKTDVGQTRKNNEDNFAVNDQIKLFIVADGMGGHNSGEVASKMAAEVINNNLKRSIERQNKTDGTQVIYGESNPDFSENANQLASAIRLANQVIYESSRTHPQNQGMGTTVVSVFVDEKKNSYIVGWVGDSRVYLIRHNNIQQLTTDHSLVQEQISRGLISSDQAEASDYKNILTRALGSNESVDVDIVEIPSMPEDFLILCSDGLTRMISDEKILEIVNNNTGKNPQEICDNLIKLANDSGGKDNVTAVCIHNKSQNIWDKFIKKVSNI